MIALAFIHWLAVVGAVGQLSILVTFCCTQNDSEHGGSSWEI